MGTMFSRFLMSNYTDGKKALSVGDFAKAEAKLFKALDNRPDDGELWWSVMLCKNHCRNDDELISSLKASFAAAAREGGTAPSTPFESTYCKNALRFERGQKRKDFVSALNAELSEIWAAERGRPLKVKPPKTVKKVKSANGGIGKAEIFRCLTYAAGGVSAVGGALAVYSIFALARRALWSGFVVFLVFAVMSVVFRRFTVRAGGNAKYALPLIVGVFAAVCVGLLIAGIVRHNRDVIIFSASVLVIIVMASAFRLTYNKFASRAVTRDKHAGDPTRDPIELASRGAQSNIKGSKNSKDFQGSEKSKMRTVDNEYKDDYD